MISGTDLQLMVEELKKRNCLLYHACHLRDFYSYLELRGVPSRHLMEAQNLDFTKFYTDEQDKADNVFDKVFLNFSDFGNTFNRGGRATPLIYGPILLAIDPIALLEATDVAVCLRSAGSPKYSREQESLKGFLEFKNIFADQKGRKIKTSDQLQCDFVGYKVGGQPEISCTIESQLVSTKYWKYILVDPIVIQNISLIEAVKGTLKEENISIKTLKRGCRGPMSEADYKEIYDIASKVQLGFEGIAHQATSKTIRDWAIKMQNEDTDRKRWSRFKLFQSYFQNGTLNFISENPELIEAALKSAQ